MDTDIPGAMDRETALELITSSDSPLAVSVASIQNIEYKVFTHAPAHMRDVFEFSNTHFCNNEFLVYEDERLTYGETHLKSVALSKSLLRHGIQPGDRVAISMRNYPEYVFAIEAILAIGAVAVTLNAWWLPDEIEYGLRDSGARFAFVDHERWDRFIPSRHLLDSGVAIARPEGELPSDVLSMESMMQPGDDDVFPEIDIHPDSDALIMYTSGSTDHPKGVVLTHRGIISALLNFSCIGPLRLLTSGTEDDRAMTIQWLKGGAASMDDPLAARFPREKMLVNIPFFHVSGLHTMLFLSYWSGRTIVLMRKWEVQKALELIEGEGLTRVDGVPTLIGEILNYERLNDYDLSSIDAIAGGGAARPAEHVKLLEERLPHVLPGIGYGMTETNAAGATNWGEEYRNRPTSSGRASEPLIQIEIRDGSGNALRPNQDGEICMKSAVNMRCYWNKPKETDETMRDGWIHSGDLGHLDDEGFLFITGRAKDVIIRGGENITCGEIENALHDHPAVNEAAVHGTPDERLGEIVCATVYLKEGSTATSEEIQDHVHSRLAAFKIPTHVHFCDQPLPRIASGKFDKLALKQAAIERLQKTIV